MKKIFVELKKLETEGALALKEGVSSILDRLLGEFNELEKGVKKEDPSKQEVLKEGVSSILDRLLGEFNELEKGVKKEDPSKQEVVGGFKGFTEIPNDGHELKCGYFALAACIYYLPNTVKRHIEERLLSADSLPIHLDSDVKIYQKVLGEALYQFSVSPAGQGVFADALGDFQNGLEVAADFEADRGIEVDGDISRVVRQEAQEVQVRDIDVNRERLSIIAQHFGLGLAINHEEEDSRFEHQVRLKNDGGHFTALVTDLAIFQSNERRVYKRTDV